MNDARVENIILENLINNDTYFRAALPFLEEEYFESKSDRTIVKFIKLFAEKHSKAPNQKILSLMVKEYTGFSQSEYEEASETVASLTGIEENSDWLLERTEKYCKDRALYIAIMDSINIMEGNKSDLNKEAIPTLLQDALSISFDKSVGHDFYDDAESRWDFYHEKLNRVPFHLDIMNKITKGGLPTKSLSVILASTGIGKSLFMCDAAAHNIRDGKNVLYITLEMAEERIAERIDCNLLDCTLDELERIKKPDYVSKMSKLKDKACGKLIIKEYPTGGAHVGHFRSLLEELKMKRNFVPDIIYIDYINICSSQRYKAGGSNNSYTVIKGIAEEIRGLAVEYNVPIMSATQTNRGGAQNTDVELTDTSECIFVEEKITLRDGSVKRIGDVCLGEQIISQDDYKTVVLVHHKKMKECVSIKLKSGKEIIVSKDHVFPTSLGRMSVNNGLSVGMELNSVIKNEKDM